MAYKTDVSNLTRNFQDRPRRTRSRKKRHKNIVKRVTNTCFIFMLCYFCFLFGRITTSASEEKEIAVYKEYNTGNNLKKDNKTTINKLDWNLILVNSKNILSKGYKPELKEVNNGHFIDIRAYPDLQRMMEDARAEGLSPIICSSYRTMDKQTQLFNKQVQDNIAKGYSKEKAEEMAAIWVATPGTSEHQLGLALDIVSEEYQLLDKSQEETPEQKWLIENCSKYGFILRYPTNKSGITGIGYEPWHYRYVGVETATEIMKKGICLEEYLEKI